LIETEVELHDFISPGSAAARISPGEPDIADTGGKPLGRVVGMTDVLPAAGGQWQKQARGGISTKFPLADPKGGTKTDAPQGSVRQVAK
jgi:hypothetical protein